MYGFNLKFRLITNAQNRTHDEELVTVGNDNNLLFVSAFKNKNCKRNRNECKR